MSNTDLRQHCYAMGYSDEEVGAFYDGYEKGREDAIKEIKELAHEDVTTGNMIISLVNVEKLKYIKEENK